MKYFLSVISLYVIYSTSVVAGVDVMIVDSLDTLPCWASSEKLINKCKTFLTDVQAYMKETSADSLRAAQDDVLLAAQVSVDASFNACQTILNVNAALKLAMPNNNPGMADLLL